MTMHAHVRRPEPGSQTGAAEPAEAATPVAAVGFRPAPLSSSHGLLRRQLLDESAEEDVFDAAAGKRDAEVQNLSLDRHVSGQDHSALEQFVAGRQARGLQQRPMAELRATRKIADNRIRKSVRSGVDAARAQHAVTGEADRSGLEQGLATKAARGADFNPTEHVKGERRARRNQRRAEARDKHNAAAAERNRAAGVEIQRAKDAVTARSAGLKTVLKHGRAAIGTEYESAEIAQFEAAYAAKDWKEAAAALDRVEAASTAALNAARSRLDGRAADIATVENAPDYHRPPDLDARRKVVEAAIANKEWPTIGTRVTDFLTVVDLARDFASRLADVEAETEGLTNDGRQRFMKEQIAEHKKLGWAKIRDTAASTSKPALTFLEQRLEEYQDIDAKAEAAKGAAAAAAAAALKAAVDKKAAARALRKERLDKGLLSGNETVLAEKKLTDLAGTGEQAAVKQTLDAIKNNTVPVLTHNNGKRWAFPHQNRDGDLPGARGSGGYLEYYVEKDPASTTYHGNRRIVVHQATKRAYYTWTHYGENGSPAFVLITE